MLYQLFAYLFYFLRFIIRYKANGTSVNSMLRIYGVRLPFVLTIRKDINI